MPKEAAMPNYFFDKAGDRRMERQNPPRWEAIVGHLAGIRRYIYVPLRKWTVLDWGCHTGGLLRCILESSLTPLKQLAGVEPLEKAREECARRVPGVRLFSDLSELTNESVTAMLSNEVLYLVEDLRAWTREVRRVLQPEGVALIALGSHSENTAWLRWREQLMELYGHVSYVHQPMEILRIAAEEGFEPELAHLFQPLGTTHVRYSSPEGGWGEFESSEEMLNHKEKFPLLFVLYKPE